VTLGAPALFFSGDTISCSPVQEVTLLKAIHEHFRCHQRIALLIAIAALIVSPTRANAVQAAGNTAMKIMAHYMPWYQAAPFSSSYGWHWTMNTFNPYQIKDGRQDIASHYQPLIGAYDSGDPNVLEYHALLMRLAGIDGVIFDWYGRRPQYDYAAIHKNTQAFIDVAKQTQLLFAVCYEDQTLPILVERRRIKPDEKVEEARREIEWLHANWFTATNYLKLHGRPVLLSFGQNGLSDAQWSQVLTGAPGNPIYLSEHNRRTAAAGAFDWPIPQTGLSAQDAFFKAAVAWPAAIPVAFPRFNDIYAEANVHPGYGVIDDDNGRTFSDTLARALKSEWPVVQIATWNDWGEGTIIEPSVEFGYRDLEVIQALRRQFVEPAFKPTAADLRLPLRLYELRLAAKNTPALMRELDVISKQLTRLETKTARAALDRIEKQLP
jgi:hypothetical protein